MSTPTKQPQQVLRDQLAEAKKNVAGLEAKLRSLDSLLASISSQRQQYDLLGEICVSLQKLGEMGAADLFWATQPGVGNPEQKLQRVRHGLDEFQQKIAAVNQSRSSVQSSIKDQSNEITLLIYELNNSYEERTASRGALERVARQLPYRPIDLPWSKPLEDGRRFRNVLLIFSILAIALGLLVSQWQLPPPDLDKELVIPKRMAKMIEKKKIKPPEIKAAEKKEEKLADEEKEKVPVTTGEKKQARATAETKGVMAFKKDFADLMDDGPSPTRIGASGRLSNSGKQESSGTAGRSVIMAQGGSGGINTSGLSRQGTGGGGGSGGQGITSPGVKFARVESALGTAMKEADRPLSKGSGPSRTDEDVQIVFDKYKSALYRIYYRELRNDPSLRGKMVLRITIEPDGRVSACSVKSTDMDAPALSADIVARVLKFNFGAKEGVPAVTILYPIDFLPET